MGLEGEKSGIGPTKESPELVREKLEAHPRFRTAKRFPLSTFPRFYQLFTE
jgi:hypothetical protein